MTLTYQSLYDEYREETTHRIRRQLTYELKRAPSWLELMMRLAENAGPVTAPPQRVEVELKTDYRLDNESKQPRQLSFWPSERN